MEELGMEEGEGRGYLKTKGGRGVIGETYTLLVHSNEDSKDDFCSEDQEHQQGVLEGERKHGINEKSAGKVIYGTWKWCTEIMYGCCRDKRILQKKTRGECASQS